MKKSVNIRIDKKVYDDLVFLKGWIRLATKKRLTLSSTMDYMNQSFIKSRNITKREDIREVDKSDRMIKINDGALKEYRVDTNIPSELRDDIKIIQYALNREKVKEEKRLTMNDVLRFMVDRTMDDFPKIKQLKNEDKFLVQRIRWEEIKRKKMGLDPDD